jgi:hypothetical protein
MQKRWKNKKVRAWEVQSFPYIETELSARLVGILMLGWDGLQEKQ